MAGLYIHIPFCKKACHYCDFHFSTQLDTRTAMVDAITSELLQRKDYLAHQQINTIYFGGGTPSLLTSDELGKVLTAIKSNFNLATDVEVTLEANPDDISEKAVIEKLKLVGINRLSIGIQSFVDEHLSWMNRAHNVQQALDSVKHAKELGFDNITVDLIYGIPGMTTNQWADNIKRVIDMGIQHVSAYCLTVEERTALHKQVVDGRVKEVADEVIEEQVNTLVSMLNAAGIERYEISNFAKKGFESKHNSAYWDGTWYLGVGPSAHSFNGTSREWNISNNNQYIKQVELSEGYTELEPIDETTAYNEYIMTRVRTREGIDLSEVKKRFLIDIQTDFEEEIADLLEDEEAVLENNHLKLTHTGMFFADGIAASLFLEKDE